MTIAHKWMLLKLGLSTLLGIKRYGYFIPYRHIEAAAQRQLDDFAGLKPLFETHRGSFGEILEVIESFRDDLLAISGLKPPLPRFEQDWFARLDAAAHYALIRHLRPKRLIEVGSGHSTRFACKAIADGGIECQLSAIDPAPRADISSLPIELHKQSLETMPLDFFDQLEPGDFLIIDSSHILMPGTDVDIAINHILPRLKPGTIIFFHDIFLPFAYPAEWPFSLYNEQNAVAALLQGACEPVFASAYVMAEMQQQAMNTVIGDLPFPDGAIENGLWLRKV